MAGTGRIPGGRCSWARWTPASRFSHRTPTLWGEKCVRGVPGLASLGSEHHRGAFGMTIEGMGSCLAVEGATARVAVSGHVSEASEPTLRVGQIVVMDNLSARQG